jgi:hypothetical protein
MYHAEMSAGVRAPATAPAGAAHMPRLPPARRAPGRAAARQRRGHPCQRRDAATRATAPSTQRVLFPAASSGPRLEGSLAVAAPHVLAWQEWGSPEGLPVVVVHGGPGAACFANHV